MKIICFAGPNGSGKSTIVNKFIDDEALKDLKFVNADNIAREFFSHIEDSYKRNKMAAIYADRVRKKLLDEKESFIFETVLSDKNSDHSKFKFLKQAKDQGAYIIVVYVLTRDPDINVERVSKRETEGGHAVPEDKIRSRYQKCIDILPEVIDLSDKAIIVDNTEKFKVLLHKNDRDLHIMDITEKEYQFVVENVCNRLKCDYYISNLSANNTTKLIENNFFDNETII